MKGKEGGEGERGRGGGGREGARKETLRDIDTQLSQTLGDKNSSLTHKISQFATVDALKETERV